MRNINLFNKYASEILIKLYESFPQEVKIIVSEDEFPDEEAFNIYVFTIKWLQKEGFIRYEKEGLGGVFTGICLSSKGLKALKKYPVSLNEEKPVGSLLKEALKEGSKVMINKLLEEIL